jgi:hypothetical protein
MSETFASAIDDEARQKPGFAFRTNRYAIPLGAAGSTAEILRHRRTPGFRQSIADDPIHVFCAQDRIGSAYLGVILPSICLRYVLYTGA